MITAKEAKALVDTGKVALDKKLEEVSNQIRSAATNGKRVLEVHFGDTEPHEPEYLSKVNGPSLFTGKVAEALRRVGYHISTIPRTYEARGSGETLQTYFLEVRW